MAKAQKTKTSPDIKTLIKKNEFAIGAGTIVVLILLGAFGLSLNKSTPANLRMVDTKIEKSASISATSTQIDEKQMKIRALSNTSSLNYVTVRGGDSYSRIANRYCGNGKIYMLLSELNGNQVLHPGDLIKVSCSK